MKKNKLYLSSLFSIIFSFEAIFVLFLFAGRFKGDPRFDWFPMDLTLFFLGLSFFAGIYILLKREFRFSKLNLSFFFIFFLFAGYILMSNLWTPSNIYAKEKTLLFIGFIGWIFFATSNIIATDIMRVKRFFITIVLFGLWVLFESLLSMAGSAGSFINVLGGNYLGVGRILGFLSCIIATYILFGKLNGTQKVGLSFVLLGAIYLMFSVGGRGPFIALLASFFPLIYYMFYLRNDSVRIRKRISIVIGLASLLIIYLLYMFITAKIPTTILRLFVMFEQEGMGASAGARFNHYKLGAELWTDKFMVGHGIGSWPLLSSFIDERGYPHNILIEILVELGIIGLLIFILMHIKGISLLLKANKLRDPMSIAITASLLFFFINALVSGDLNDNRYYFAVLGLIPICKLIIKNKEEGDTRI